MKKLLVMNLLFVMALVSCQTREEDPVFNRESTEDYYGIYRWETGPDGITTLIPQYHTKDLEVVPLSIYSNENIINHHNTSDYFERLRNGKGFPWKINGKVDNGQMLINFPDDPLTLDPDYGEYTDGVRIAEILIKSTDETRWLSYYLRKFTNDHKRDHQVLIYYASEDYDKLNDGAVSLKAGWNFIEFYSDPYVEILGSPLIDIYKDRWEFGLVSQDINDFYKIGYRWFDQAWW